MPDESPYTFERKGASWRVLHGRREVWSSTDALQSMKIMQLLNAETRPVQLLRARIVELQSMEDAELESLRSELAAREAEVERLRGRIEETELSNSKDGFTFSSELLPNHTYATTWWYWYKFGAGESPRVACVVRDEQVPGGYLVYWAPEDSVGGPVPIYFTRAMWGHPVFRSRDAIVTEFRSEIERLRKPTHYWYEDLEYAIDGPEQVVSEQHIEQPGEVFEVTPIHAMGKQIYATVPDKSDDSAEWADGDYCGDLEVIGPFATLEEARNEADRLTAEAAKEADRA
jgi:hypothetical protein